MQYVGSKNRISRELAPIIQSYINEHTNGYLEPFVGGANMIDKIRHHNKVGCDIHKELIALLKYSQVNELPYTVSEAEYTKVRDNKSDYDDWYVGLVGFCASFGAKYFGGFARRYNSDGTLFDVPRQAINSLRRQASSDLFKNTKFINCDFLDISTRDIKNYVIYCDIPYVNTTKYSTSSFPYDDFYNWAIMMSEHNSVLISEYWMPSEFVCVWQKELKTSLGSGVNRNNDNIRVEKLFTVNPNL